MLDSNYYILIVQLSQRDPIILKFRTQSKKPHRAVIEISHPPCLSIEAKAGMNNRGWARFWGQDHVCTRRRPRSFLIDRKSSTSQEVGVISRLFSLSLSLYTCNGIPMFRFSPVYHLESHLDLSKSAIVSPAERKMVARTCAGFLLPSIVGKNLSFTDKASSFNGTPLMRDILVDREISGTWSLVSYRGEHAVCSIRFFSLLSFSHGFDNWFCLAIIISVYG